MGSDDLKVKLIQTKKNTYQSNDDYKVEFTGTKTSSLKRSLSFMDCLAFVVGGLVGSGIFVSPALVAKRTPNSFVAICVWLISGLISLLGSLCYCELVSIIQKTGSTYIFVHETYGGCISFMLLMTVVLIMTPCVTSLMILIIGNYGASIFFEDRESAEFIWCAKLIGLFFFYICAVFSCFGVQKSGRMQLVLNVVLATILSILIVAGIYHLIQTKDFINFTPDVMFNNTISGVLDDLPSFGSALFNALYCFDGWYMIAFFIEEIYNPKKNIPLLASVSLPLVTSIYIIVNIACLTTLSHEEMGSAIIVFSKVFEKIGGKKFAFIVPFFVIITTSSSVLGFFYHNSRFIMSAAREGQLPKIFSMIHSEKRSPIPALLLITVFGTVVTVSGFDFENLIQYYNVAIWIEYGMAFSTVIYLRYKFPNVERTYKVWITTPIFMMIVSLVLIILMFIQSPYSAIFYVLFIVLTFPLYYITIVKDYLSCLHLSSIDNFLLRKTKLVYCVVSDE